ncbi:MAG: molecular chaperone [Bacteroidetes bacterium]|nr:molecular chaperone [Bacteroidota bacterium]MBS1629050.1 molecular chaperone [Bacteroidota bacterium]
MAYDSAFSAETGIQSRSLPWRAAAFWILLSLLPSFAAVAQGNLLVTPRRLVFEGGPRVRELNLANTGKDTARYAISMMEIRMKEDGSFEQINSPDSGQRFASNNLRIYPRAIYIPPGGAQVVKVQLINADQLSEGEYRSHVYIRSIPMEPALGDSTAPKTQDLTVKLTAIFGISIPAIIRVGENNTQVSVSNPSFVMLDDKTPQLSIVLRRNGNMSSYGNITVDFIKDNGKTVQVGIVKGIAIYTPNTIRRFHMTLDNNHKVDYHEGTLRIRYSSEKDAQRENFSETTLALQ